MFSHIWLFLAYLSQSIYRRVTSGEEGERAPFLLELTKFILPKTENIPFLMLCFKLQARKIIIVIWKEHTTPQVLTPESGTVNSHFQLVGI